MITRLEDRITYGRSIRERALCLIEAHGTDAEALALDAASETGLPEPQRIFWQAVAGRIARLHVAKLRTLNLPAWAA